MWEGEIDHWNSQPGPNGLFCEILYFWVERCEQGQYACVWSNSRVGWEWTIKSLHVVMYNVINQKYSQYTQWRKAETDNSDVSSRIIVEAKDMSTWVQNWIYLFIALLDGLVEKSHQTANHAPRSIVPNLFFFVALQTYRRLICSTHGYHRALSDCLRYNTYFCRLRYSRPIPFLEEYFCWKLFNTHTPYTSCLN